MDRIVKNVDYDLWFDHIERPYEFTSPFDGADFVLMLIVVDPAVTPEERGVVSNEIIRLGCRYAVCMGYECSKWHDAIDMAYISADPNFNPPDDRFVMTSCHENEKIVDVAFFFRMNTSFDYFTAHNFLVVALGANVAVEEVTREALAKWFDFGI